MAERIRLFKENLKEKKQQRVYAPNQNERIKIQSSVSENVSSDATETRDTILSKFRNRYSQPMLGSPEFNSQILQSSQSPNIAKKRASSQSKGFLHYGKTGNMIAEKVPSTLLNLNSRKGKEPQPVKEKEICAANSSKAKKVVSAMWPSISFKGAEQFPSFLGKVRADLRVILANSNAEVQPWENQKSTKVEELANELLNDCISLENGDGNMDTSDSARTHNMKSSIRVKLQRVQRLMNGSVDNSPALQWKEDHNRQENTIDITNTEVRNMQPLADSLLSDHAPAAINMPTFSNEVVAPNYEPPKSVPLKSIEEIDIPSSKYFSPAQTNNYSYGLLKPRNLFGDM